MTSQRSRYLATAVFALILVGGVAVARLWGRVPIAFSQISIALILVYVLLLVGVMKRRRAAFAGLLVMSLVVIVGNSLTVRHLEVLSGLAPPIDILLVALTGYVFQIPIAVLSYLEFRKPSGS
jgi:hypothetical protein